MIRHTTSFSRGRVSHKDETSTDVCVCQGSPKAGVVPQPMQVCQWITVNKKQMD